LLPWGPETDWALDRLMEGKRGALRAGTDAGEIGAGVFVVSAVHD